MKKYLSLLITLLILTPTAGSVARAQSQQKTVTGQRRYDLIVTQANDTLSFNRNLRSIRGLGANRSILTDIASNYLSLGTSTLLNASQTLLNAGISWIVEAARDKRPDWEKAIKGECKFVKHLPSQTEILDFYASPSQLGPMDPTGMLFSGFGCRQYVVTIDENGEEKEDEVFYMSCRLKDSPEGIMRMLNHSKFEVEVDELRFNPYLCNLPNDSLGNDVSTRIDFDFDKRKNLEFKIVANVSSSWLNEAMQVANDVPLGQFVITAKIDPKKLDADNVFRYKRGEDENSGKVVNVMGDSFLVPRSYVGFASLDDPQPSWGTGQYKVEMDISESCSIDEKYYTYTDSKGKKKWNNEWKKEWKMIKKRPKRKGGNSASLVEMLFPQFVGQNWITTLIEPSTSAFIQHEGRLVNAASAKVATKINANPSAQTPSNPGSGGAGSGSGKDRK